MKIGNFSRIRILLNTTPYPPQSPAKLLNLPNTFHRIYRLSHTIPLFRNELFETPINQKQQFPKLYPLPFTQLYTSAKLRRANGTLSFRGTVCACIEVTEGPSRNRATERLAGNSATASSILQAVSLLYSSLTRFHRTASARPKSCPPPEERFGAPHKKHRILSQREAIVAIEAHSVAAAKRPARRSGVFKSIDRSARLHEAVATSPKGRLH